MSVLFQYLVLVASVGIIVLTFHFLHSSVLERREKIGFTAAAGFLLMTNIMEEISYSTVLTEKYQGIFTLVILLEMMLGPLTVPAECYAFGQKKWTIIGLIGCAVYGVIAVIVYFTGNLFSLDAAGNYTSGYDVLMSGCFSIIDMLYMAVMLYNISRGSEDRNLVTLAGIVLLTVVFTGGTCVTENVGIIIVGGALSFMLVYTYYSSLKQKELQKTLRQMFAETIQSIVTALDAKDQYTNGHSQRVAKYSGILAEHLGYNERQIEFLKYAAELHDVGKIAIPDGVLNKPGRLGLVEFSLMKQHTVKGSEIARMMTLFPEAYNAARSHHERFDGKGYPDGLSGKDIPEIARIISIADAFDAMNSDRIYRKALPKNVVREEMCKGSGTQFDPDFLKVFVQLYDDGMLDEVARSGREDMIPEVKEDRFRMIVRDVLEFFTVRYEYIGEWEEEYDKWDLLKSYIKKVAPDNEIEFSIVVISIHPAENREVSDWQMEDALNVMKSSAAEIMNREDICGKMSRHQLALVIKKEDGKTMTDLENTIKEIFLYFYKIFESEPFKIEYRIVQ